MFRGASFCTRYFGRNLLHLSHASRTKAGVVAARGAQTLQAAAASRGLLGGLKWPTFIRSSDLAKAEQEANNNPADAALQARYLQLLNAKNPEDVRVRFETDDSKYAFNDEAKRQYLIAMATLNKTDAVRVDLLQRPWPAIRGPPVAPGSAAADAPSIHQTAGLSSHSTAAGAASTVTTPPPANIQHATFAYASAPAAQQAPGAALGGDPAAAPSAAAVGGAWMPPPPPPGVQYLPYPPYFQPPPGFAASALAEAARPMPVAIVTSTWEKVLSVLRPLLVAGLFVGAYWYVTNEDRKAMAFPIPNAHQTVRHVDEKFENVLGVDEAKAELMEVVEYLRNPDKFAAIGARLPKGVLLIGEPGTGKTLMARAIAGEAGVPFLYCSGSSFDELYVGVGPKRIRALFEDARKLAPCIIFIDEIDAMGQARKMNLSSSYAKESTLNQMLTEMDGFEKTSGIIVIAATNLPESLDDALVRPGRFDKQIHVPVPDMQGRKKIIEMYLSKVVVTPDVDSRTLARGTPGFTGADLSNLINLAAVKAAVRGREAVDMRLLEEAKDDVLMGVQRVAVERNEESRRMTAVHEGGHALVALYTKGAHPLHKVTIIRRGSALGVTQQLPEKDVESFSKQQMLARLAVCMGGRAAEELVFGEEGVTSGASSDLQQATALARMMVERWGFSRKVGTVFHDEERYPISPAERNLIDQEVKQILHEAMESAKRLLQQRSAELNVLVESLLEFETLSGEQIQHVLSGKKLNPAV